MEVALRYSLLTLLTDMEFVASGTSGTCVYTNFCWARVKFSRIIWQTSRCGEVGFAIWLKHSARR